MQRFKKILCVMEHGEASKPALERAVALAENNQAELTVVDVIERLPAGVGMPDGGPISRNLQAVMVREHEARIVSLLEPYRQRFDVKHGVLMGTAFLEIIRMVLRNGHDLVVKCPESPSWLDRFFSGDDMHLLRKCPCPVWLVKTESPRSYKRILAAVDVDESYLPTELATRHALNVQILEMAASLAISESSELHVVHAWDSVYESISGFVVSSDISPEKEALSVEQERRQHQQWLDTFLRHTGNKETRDALGYRNPQTHLIKGGARKEIPALAKRLQIDCIVMGTVARTGVMGFIVGNTAETILEQIDCSVLAIKPEGFKTPVTLDEKR
ncbi:MAG: universal stress protein [Gammaproteobacteria bacterium]|nr:universal stress protein [Gammaproteobacteria bacterium]